VVALLDHLELDQAVVAGTSLGANVTRYEDTGVTAGQTYTYRVRATNPAGTSAYSNAAAASPVAPAVNSATFVKADTTTQGNWKGVYGAQGHNVINDSVAYPAYAQVTVTGAGAWTWNANATDVPSLLKGSAATGRISSAWYAGASFTFDVNVTDGQKHQLAVYVRDPAGSRNQTVEVLDPSTGAVLHSQGVAGFFNGRYLVYDVTGKVRFRVTNLVSGSNAVVNGLFFDAGPVTATAPAAPTNLAAASAAPGTVDLTWTDASADEQGFRVERSTDGTSFTEVGYTYSANDTGHSDYGLTAGTTYYYRVRARNSAGDSDYSAVASATPAAPAAPAAPVGLTAQAAAAGRIDLAWGHAAPAGTWFEVQRSTDGTSFGSTVTVYSGTRYSASGLSPATRYYFRVRAANDGGSSGYSNTADATTVLGSVTAEGGSLPFAAAVVTAPEGLYDGRANVDGVAVRIGWIALDGTVTGGARAAGEIVPAPPLDPADPAATLLDGVPVVVTAVDGASVGVAR